jgi:hypothetical protein
MIIADDGGAQVSFDAGENWTTYHNQPTAQYYRVVTDNHFPYRIYGASKIIQRNALHIALMASLSVSATGNQQQVEKVAISLLTQLIMM